jgi:hypothetical protein
MNIQLFLLVFVAIVAGLNGSKVVRESDTVDKIYYLLVMIGYISLLAIIMGIYF